VEFTEFVERPIRVANPCQCMHPKVKIQVSNINERCRVMPREERAHDGLTLQRARTGASLAPCDLFLELIDPFLQRAQSEFPHMLAGSRALLRFEVKLLQFLQFQPRGLKLMPTVDGHGTTPTIPFGTRLRSVANVRSVNCWKARGSTSSMLIKGNQIEKRPADER
jgi:hypothetical protein